MKKLITVLFWFTLLTACEAPQQTAKIECTEEQVISHGITRAAVILSGGYAYGGC